MLEQIAQIEKDQAASGSLGFISSAPQGAGENTEDPDEVIKNVEKMLLQEKQAAKDTAKKGAKLVSFDMNEGIVGSVGKSKTSTVDGQQIDPVTGEVI